MKTIIVSVAALFLGAGLAGHADAATHQKKKRLHASQYGTQYPRAYSSRREDDSIGGYYEHRLEAVRFGSQRWWKIYDEQNGGSHRP
jgi:hypothetical protein